MKTAPPPGAFAARTSPPWRTTIARDDREPEPAARRHAGAGARGVGLVEPIEDVRQVLGRNARAGIGHRDADAIAVRLGEQRDPAAVRRVPDGVGRHVLQRLLEPVGVPPDVRRARRRRRVQRDPPIAEHRPVPVGDAAEQIVGQHFLLVERAAASFEARQIQQLPDDRFELVRLLVRDVEVAAARPLVELQLRHAQRFDVAADRGQRRHQLVRHVREQLAAHPIRFGQRRRAGLQVRGHGVERRRQRADFVAAGLVGAHVGASFAERAGRVLQVAQAAMGRPEDHQRHERRADAEQTRFPSRSASGRSSRNPTASGGRLSGTATVPARCPG